MSHLALDLSSRSPRSRAAADRAAPKELGTTKLLQCDRCIFRFAGQLTCVAFPKGIPAEIAEGRFDHSKPHEEDGGIRFVPSRQHERLPEDPEDLSHLGFGK